jgi:hypothetical protein
MEVEMKFTRISWATTLVVVLALIATPVLAMEKHSGHDMAGEMKHDSMDSMQGMDHDQKGTIMLGEQEQDGVKAMFHLMPIDPKNMPAGHQATHHLMVMFNDTSTNQPVLSGTVAVKVGSPEGHEGEALKMMPMQGEFGVDVNLDRPGTWHLRIATKLADGKVRQFNTSHMME